MLKRLIALLIAFYASISMAAIDINKASQQELTQIKGIGPATAAHIIDARTQSPFVDWNDFIARVKGIAPKTAGHLSEQGLTVNGQPFNVSPEKSTKTTNPLEKATKPTQTSGSKEEKR